MWGLNGSRNLLGREWLKHQLLSRGTVVKKKINILKIVNFDQNLLNREISCWALHPRLLQLLCIPGARKEITKKIIRHNQEIILKSYTMDNATVNDST